MAGTTLSEDNFVEQELCSQLDEVSDEVFGFGDDLELNQFDGLPYSSRYYKLLKERKTLPVWKVRSEFMKALDENQFIIISGTVKSGKSTQIPQWCAEFCLAEQYRHGMVVCTQILRQQAVDLALRVADEMDVNIGHEVGYSIPLETCCSSDTVLRYCTDDVLLREMMSDPLLEHYGAVVIDQAHERTVSTDLLLGLLREVMLQRPELKVVVLSAQPFSNKLLLHYGNVPHLSLEALHPSEVVHSNSSHKECFYSALRLVLEIHRTKEAGDIALFLASEQEVGFACSILCKEGSKLSVELGELVPVILCPGHAGTYMSPTEEQPRRRRVFLSCSQSEDMFWPVDTVNFVIDTGVEKRYVYNPRVRANSEEVRSISRCQSDIRKQLTGSTGKCFCLYPGENQLPGEIPPKILESNITPTVLFLKRMEVAGLGQCDFIDRPDPEGLMQALEELDYLAALDDDGNLSEIGIIMSEFPLDPQMAKALLASCEFDCVSEVLTIAAMLAAPSCFLEPPVGMATEAVQCHMKLQHPEGDHFTLINIYNAFKRSQKEPYFSLERWCQDYFLCCAALQTADAIRSELSDILRRIELPISEPAFGTKTNTLNIKRALLAGFFMQIARDVDGSGNYFMLTNKHVAQIHPLSSYGPKSHQLGLPEWVLYHEYTLSENNCIRTVSQISPEVFIQMAPQYFFYNLPPSESKDILQHILDNVGSGNCKKKPKSQQPITSETKKDCGESQSSDRCVLQ
ncbi:DEAD/H (Asp-Glu-Ala-Asp/His) box polypeptide 32a [Chanos chanos]|uniref:DEAD/H (Asp-Glu-Ala-Asp/His) box polypeptide 32a n=1 Tax=Chanos chanos TaxID=29144 RepID=A0A6J2VF09_CHACN|nr:putative pre-mRNA-splicing factor ATP-dependent RNA helicase DHX32 [Chanos chanos]